MNTSEFIHLLQHTNPTCSPQQTRELEELIEEYPFFQPTRALHAKALQHLNSDQYPKALKATAAYTADREVLFDYLTSGEFAQHSAANIIADRIAAPEKAQSSLTNEPETPHTNTPLGGSTPIAYHKKEKHSFTAWLQLTQNGPLQPPAQAEQTLEKRKKFALLDKFIESNPKIVPKKGVQLKVDVEASTQIDKNELMTETLARVYVEQKKYKKAIQAFKILRLKYPKKSGFFADQIRAIQQQQNP